MSGITITGSVTIGQGVSIDTRSPTLMLSLDAAGYTSGPWIDTVSGRSFTLNGGVTYDSGNGGSLVFDPTSAQYAECTSSLPNLNKWTVEVWHYYAGTNTGGSPCIVTETFLGAGINYTLGSIGSGLDAGWFNGGQWIYTNTGYNLTPGNWYQIVGTYDGNFPKLYVNNTLIATGNVSGGSAYSSGGGIRLMERWDSADYWGGKLGIVNIYDGAMNQREISSSWNANKTRFGLGGPAVNTLGITAWDPDYIGPHLTICAPGTYENPVAGQLELAATQEETSSGLALMDGSGSLFDNGPLVMFTMYVNVEDSGDVAAGLASIGVGYHTADLTQPLGMTNDSFGWKQDGTIWYGGAQINDWNNITWGPGDYMDIALNLTTNKAWMRVNGGNWNGRTDANPVTGAHGQVLGLDGSGAAGSGTDIYPAANPGANGYYDAIDISQVTFNIPAGYNAI
jgi:hypothetical protein